MPTTSDTEPTYREIPSEYLPNDIPLRELITISFIGRKVTPSFITSVAKEILSSDLSTEELIGARKWFPSHDRV